MGKQVSSLGSAGERGGKLVHAVVVTLHRAVRESLPYKVTSKQTEVSEGVSHVDIRKEHSAQGPASACKDLNTKHTYPAQETA